MHVVCAGHVNWDVTLFVDRFPAADAETRIERIRQSGGGSAANVAVGLSGLDVSTGVIGSVGTDEHGFLARRALSEAGVDVDGLQTVQGETAIKYLIVPTNAEVLVLGTDGLNEAVSPPDIDIAPVRRADHLHLTGQRPATASYLGRVAEAEGLTVSFDPGRRVEDRNYDAVYPFVDLLFVTASEAAAVDRLPVGATTLTKHGAGGAVVDGPDGRHEHSGYGVDPVDTAGAGDAFAAGFLASWLDGTPPKESLAVANACGAIAAKQGGAQSRLDWAAVGDVRAARDE